MTTTQDGNKTETKRKSWVKRIAAVLILSSELAVISSDLVFNNDGLLLIMFLIRTESLAKRSLQRFQFVIVFVALFFIGWSLFSLNDFFLDSNTVLSHINDLSKLSSKSNGDSDVSTPNLSQALAIQLDAAKTTFKNLKDKLFKAVDALRKGWWEAEEHFRMFHTHDRLASPFVRVCIPIFLEESRSIDDLFQVFLPSLKRSVESGYQYGVYLSYREGLLDEESVRKRWSDQKIFLKMLKVKREDHGINLAAREAYLDGFDYFFRATESTEFDSSLWTSKLVESLQRSEDFGVVGLSSKGGSFFPAVARTHIEIFGFLFPFSLDENWNDLWFQACYTDRFTITLRDVFVRDKNSQREKNVQMVQNIAREGMMIWKHWLCHVRQLTEFCENGEGQKKSKNNEDGKRKKQQGLSRERLIAMETKAREDQFKRMKRFPKRQIKFKD